MSALRTGWGSGDRPRRAWALPWIGYLVHLVGETKGARVAFNRYWGLRVGCDTVNMRSGMSPCLFYTCCMNAISSIEVHVYHLLNLHLV